MPACGRDGRAPTKGIFLSTSCWVNRLCWSAWREKPLHAAFLIRWASVNTRNICSRNAGMASTPRAVTNGPSTSTGSSDHWTGPFQHFFQTDRCRRIRPLSFRATGNKLTP